MINMGLSSKLVSGDGFDWSQGMVKSGGVEIPRRAAPAQRVRLQQQKQRQQPAPQQQGPQLKCPRCDSNTTKFCYYNNYSRAQPRYFCKACRRHWTEGGTLRNVPVGGGRKAKRPKTSHPSSAADPAAGAGHDNRVDNGITVPASTAPPPRPPPLQLLPPLSFAEDILSPALLKPSLAPSTYANSSYNLGSLLSLPSTPQFVGSAAAGGMLDAGGYPFSTSPTIPSFLNLTGQEDLPAIGSVDTALTASSMAPPPPLPPWELLPPPTCSGGLSGSSIATTSSDLTALDSSSPSSGAGYWGNCWEDLTSFLSTDLDHPPASEAPALHQYFELS